MLNNTTMKRISKELERDFNEFSYKCIIYHPNHRGMEINLMLNNQQEVQFKLTPEYPFKPPCLFVNDMHYIDRHKYFYNKNKKQLKNTIVILDVLVVIQYCVIGHQEIHCINY